MNQHYDTRDYRAFGQSATRTDTSGLFGQTMALVAVTVGMFTLGAYLGRDLSSGLGLAFFAASFICLLALNFAVRQSEQLALGLLFGFGLLMGLAVAPTVAHYANTDPQIVWQAGGATALFMAGFGAAGYATRRDLSVFSRALSWALFALIVFGVVLIFASIPHASVIYAVLGLAIFAGLTIVDFQRLRGTGEYESAPLLAASIFLDILNVFEFFVMLFSRDRR